MDLGWEKVPNWECLFVHRKQRLFLSVHVNDIKMAGENQNMTPMWKKLMKGVDLGEPTSFLDHIYLRCTQNECKPNEDIFNQKREMFESRISAGGNSKNHQGGKNLTQRRSRGTRHGMACSRIRSEKLRTGKQEDRAVIQSLKSLLGRTPFQEEGT